MKALTIILSMCLASFASIYLLSIFGVPVNPCPEAKTLHNLTDLAPGESLTISMPAEVDTTYRVRTIVPGPGVIVVNRQYGDSTNTKYTVLQDSSITDWSETDNDTSYSNQMRLRDDEHVITSQANNEGYNTCARCKLSVNDITCHYVAFPSGRGGQWALCEFCWKHSTVDERITFHKAMLYEQRFRWPDIKPEWTESELVEAVRKSQYGDIFHSPKQPIP